MSYRYLQYKNGHCYIKEYTKHIYEMRINYTLAISVGEDSFLLLSWDNSNPDSASQIIYDYENFQSLNNEKDFDLFISSIMRISEIKLWHYYM